MVSSPVKMWRSLQFQAVLSFVLLSSVSSLHTLTFVYSVIGPDYTAVATNQRVINLGNNSFTIVGTHLPGKTNADVTRVEFTGGEIPSILEEVFDIFPNVATLGYTNTGLFHLKSGAFAKATKLTQLTITLNFLPVIHNHPFRGATALATINLTANKTHRIESTAFSDLTSLRIINLANNRIHHVDSNSFDGLANLILVNLTGNLCPSQNFMNVAANLAIIQAACRACPF